MKILHLGREIEAEVADSGWEISKGLSFTFRKRNMFFVMPYEAKWSFWMFGMFFPLKIIFMDKNKDVIDEFDAKPMGLDPRTWCTYKPARPAKYVLEIPT